MLQNKSRFMSSHLNPEGYRTNCLPLLFFLPFPPPLSGVSASLVCAPLQGAVVSERFLNVLNPSISLCPGKKYIRMKLKRLTGSKLCVRRKKEERTCFPEFYENKKRESCSLGNKMKIKTNLGPF